MFDGGNAFRGVLLKLGGVVERWVVGVKGKGKNNRGMSIYVRSLAGHVMSNVIIGALRQLQPI